MKSDVINLVRQNFHEECEKAINDQINFELHASYIYLSMVSRRIDWITISNINVF